MKSVETRVTEPNMFVHSAAALERYLIDRQHSGLWQAVSNLNGITRTEQGITVKTIKRLPFIFDALSLSEKETRIEAGLIEGKHPSKYTSSTLSGRYVSLNRIYHETPEDEFADHMKRVVIIEAKFFKVGEDPRYRFSYREETEQIAQSGRPRRKVEGLVYEGDSHEPFDADQKEVIARSMNHVKGFMALISKSVAE